MAVLVRCGGLARRVFPSAPSGFIDRPIPSRRHRPLRGVVADRALVLGLSAVLLSGCSCRSQLDTATELRKQVAAQPELAVVRRDESTLATLRAETERARSEARSASAKS